MATWLAGGTRPDLSYAASILAKFVSHPGPAHLNDACDGLHVHTYICTTLSTAVSCMYDGLHRWYTTLGATPET